jgi:hypothetical protein
MLEVRQARSVRNEKRLKRQAVPALQVLRPEQRIEIVKFSVKHGRMLSTLPDNVLRAYATSGEAFTALLDGEPIAAGGVMIVQPGMGSGWGLITARSREMPFMLHRAVKRRLSDVIARNRLRRVDVVVHCENEAAIDWAERLGFEYEGRMKNFYADGKSAFFMARCEVRR